MVFLQQKSPIPGGIRKKTIRAFKLPYIEQAGLEGSHLSRWIAILRQRFEKNGDLIVGVRVDGL